MVPSGAWSVVSAVLLGVLLLAKLLSSRKYKNLNLPPGPRSLPLIGSLHLLGKFPQRDFAKLAETYGPLMSIWLGPRLAVVATSPAAAEEILKTQGSNFANRMDTSFSNVVLPGGTEDLPPSQFLPLETGFKLLCEDAKCNVKVEPRYLVMRNKTQAMVVVRV